MTEVLRVKTQEESWRETVDMEIVEMLEAQLERAKTGEFDGYAIIATHKDGSCSHRWSRGASFTRMLGAIQRLSYKYNEDHD